MSYIINKDTTTGELKFTLKNVEVTYANTLRRSILSMIPVVGLKTEPNENNQMVIHKNTSRLNNEITKHRFSCIPIHINLEEEKDISRYSIELHVKNDTENIIEVTTKDILIKDTLTGKYLIQEERDNVFPADPITKEHILITRLYPRIHLTSEVETLHLSCPMSVCYAMENSVYNAVSTCGYGFTPDEMKQKHAWDKVKHIQNDKENWYLHEGKRFYKPNSFDFKIESVGVYKNETIVQLGCKMIINRLKLLLQNVQNRSIEMKPGETMETSYDITISNDNYTIGKLLENTLYMLYFENEKKLSFVAYKKLHPHVDYGIIRLIFVDENETSEVEIYKLIFNCIQYAIPIYEKIAKEIEI